MSSSLRNIGANALSILTSDVMNRATSFVIYAMVARKFGAFEFGQMSLALSLFYIFLIFAAAGWKTLLIREVAKDRLQTQKYLVNGCLIVGVMSLASLGVVFGFVRAVHYVAGTKLVVLLLSLGLLPSAISAICEGIFQAWERMHYIAYVNVPSNLTKMTGAYLLLFWNRGLYAVILLLLAAFFTVAGVELWLVLTRFQAEPAPGRDRRGAGIDLRFALSTLRSASTFLGIDSTCAVAGNLNIILLSKLATEKEVGLFSAATQMMVPLLLVYQSIAQSIFPVMCRKIEPGLRTLRRIAEQAIEVLLALAVPTVAGIFFVGQWALSVLYKNHAFAEAVPALRIISWLLVPQVFSSVLGQVLVATRRERITLKIAMVSGALNLVVGWPLIRWFGLEGAATITVVTALVGSILHCIPVARLLSGISVLRTIWKPVVAAGCMAVYLAVAITRVDIFAGLSATLVYLAVFVLLAVWASGGPRQFKEKYLVLLPDKAAEEN